MTGFIGPPPWGGTIRLEDLDIVVHRGGATVFHALSARDRRYAQDEWLVSSLSLFASAGCKVFNWPYPTSPSGRNRSMTSAGHRRAMAELLGEENCYRPILTNLRPEAASHGNALIERGSPPAVVLQQARRGLELISFHRCTQQEILHFWIVARTVVSGFAVEPGSRRILDLPVSAAAQRAAEKYAAAADLRFGTMWLVPRGRGRFAFGGSDLFPPAEHAGTAVSPIVSAFCDHYA